MYDDSERAAPVATWQHSEVAQLRAELALSRQVFEFTMLELQALTKKLSPLCPCVLSSGDPRGPEQHQECPIHGDGATFVAEVQQLRVDRARLAAELDTVKQALAGVNVTVNGWNR